METINIGTGPNTGTGDILRNAWQKTNDNFALLDSTKADITALNAKQDILVSGTNIKTINGETILGSGDLNIAAGAIPDGSLTESKMNASINASLDLADTSVQPAQIADFETTTQLNARDTANRNRANHTGTQLASTISDFQSSVSSNSDVSANTTARHTHANKAILDATTASYTTAEASKLAGIESGAEVNTLNDIVAGTNITIDKTDPLNPIITSTASGTGDVTGPASSINGSIATYDGTTGKIIQDGGATIAQVRDRSTHTGTQTMSTISDAGALATLNTVDTAQIDDNAVTFAKMQDIAGSHFIGRHSTGSGDPEQVSATQARSILGLATVATSGSYTDLSNTPTIPTATSQLTNDSGYITSAPVTSVNGRTGVVTGLAEANAVVDLTTAQTVAGIKTFSSSPIVPTPTTDFEVATKKYVDDNAGGGGTLPQIIWTSTPQSVSSNTSVNFTHNLGLVEADVISGRYYIMHSGNTAGVGIVVLPGETFSNSSFYDRIIWSSGSTTNIRFANLHTNTLGIMTVLGLTNARFYIVKIY